MGFEPMNKDFADPRLWPLGYVALTHIIYYHFKSKKINPSNCVKINSLFIFKFNF